MPDSLDAALAALRPLLLDPDVLVRAVGAGRRRNHTVPARTTLRPVDLKGVRHLQVVTETPDGPVTRNTSYDDAAAVVDGLLAEPFGNWHVETTGETLQVRVTKKGDAQLHRSAAVREQRTAHDEAARHLIDPGDELFTVLGASAAKRRQVDAFVRMLADLLESWAPPGGRPLRVVDLGCGNAYLTFAAYRFLAARGDVDMTGVDVRPQARERNSRLAAELGWSEHLRFEEALIAESRTAEPETAPVDLVLSLHACDTATDDALAQAVRWEAHAILSSPCCHHDVQRQLGESDAPAPYDVLVRDPILRERFGDVLTDALRAALLRRHGDRAEVVQFVSAEHTPRNTMIRAVRDSARRDPADLDALTAAWGVTPYLQTLLADEPR